MMIFTVNETHELLTVETAEVTLGFSRDDGGLRLLRRAGGANLAGHGGPRPSVDVCLGEKGWMAERAFVRYLGYSAEERAEAVEVVVIIGIGPLMVYDRYRVTGTLITRRVSVRNVGMDEVRLRGIRMTVPWLRPGSIESCRFDAPGNSVRPRVSLAVAAAQHPDVLPRRFFAPGLRDGLALELAPTIGAGLMALYDEPTGSSLLCWYHSAVEPALPQVDGNGRSVTLTHQVEIADWLQADSALSADTQSILLLDLPWRQTLGAFRRTTAHSGAATPADAPPSAAWLRDAAIYEAHPAQFGGFTGLVAALPRLAGLGINTLCLMPIWDYGAAAGHLWDGSWQSLNPYTVASFERLDPALGDRGDLLLLVRAAHERGIRVLVDLPLNGCAPESPIVARHPEWLCRDELGRFARSSGAGAIVHFDWANAGLHDYFSTIALSLLREFDLDGFRVTPPRAARPNWARGLPYHASATTLGYLGFIERLRATFRAEHPDAALLGALGGPVCAQRQDASVDELPHHMFFHLGLGRMTPAELGEWLADHWATLPADAIRIGFTESYLTHALNPLADGMRGSHLSRMLFAGLVLCGFVPMLHAGQEQGDEEFLTGVLGARATCDALRYGDVSYTAITCDSPQVFTVLRRLDEDATIGVLNVGPRRHTVTFSLPSEALHLTNGEYNLVDLLTGERWCEDGRHTWSSGELAQIRLTLKPFGAYALALRPVEARSEHERASPVVETVQP